MIQKTMVCPEIFTSRLSYGEDTFAKRSKDYPNFKAKSHEECLHRQHLNECRSGKIVINWQLNIGHQHQNQRRYLGWDTCLYLCYQGGSIKSAIKGLWLCIIWLSVHLHTDTTPPLWDDLFQQSRPNPKSLAKSEILTHWNGRFLQRRVVFHWNLQQKCWVNWGHQYGSNLFNPISIRRCYGSVQCHHKERLPPILVCCMSWVKELQSGTRPKQGHSQRCRNVEVQEIWMVCFIFPQAQQPMEMSWPTKYLQDSHFLSLAFGFFSSDNLT